MDVYRSIIEKAVETRTLALQQSLQILEAARKESYYDPLEDQQNKKSYYKSIRTDGVKDKEIYQQVSALLKKTHTTVLSYDDARHKHLYPRVDLQPNKLLKSIYSGQEFTPEEIIANDLEISDRITRQASEQLSNMPAMNEAGFEEYLASLAVDAIYNAEHSVPQSWFAKKLPMKSDLHHLFTCDITCNEFRGNIPFFDFPNFTEAIKMGCGKKEENKFEPSQGHGAVARATLYFLLRYPKEINNNSKEYTKDRLPVLLRWHKEDVVSQYELHRNAEIFKVQGNRNPLIDHPAWGSKIDFTLGLG